MMTQEMTVPTLKKGRGRPAGSTNKAKESSFQLEESRPEIKLCLKENEKALLWEITHENGNKTYETWIKRFWSFGRKKGEIIEPEDEVFGVCAWAHYTSEQAEKAYTEITSGVRTYKAMIEATD